MTGDGGLDQDGGSRAGEKWIVWKIFSRYNWQREKDWIIHGTIYWPREAERRVGWLRKGRLNLCGILVYPACYTTEIITPSRAESQSGWNYGSSEWSKNLNLLSDHISDFQGPRCPVRENLHLLYSDWAAYRQIWIIGGMMHRLLFLFNSSTNF